MGEITPPRVGSFARWLAAAVRTRRITRIRLAADLGVSGASLSRWINGVELPSEARANDLIDRVVIPPLGDVNDAALPAWEDWRTERAQGMQAWREDKTARKRARSPESVTLVAHLTELHEQTRRALRQLRLIDQLLAQLTVEMGGDAEILGEAGSDSGEVTGVRRTLVEETIIGDFVAFITRMAERHRTGDTGDDAAVFVEIKRLSPAARHGKEEA